MSTHEFRYDSTSQDGGADWQRDFDRGAIKSNHIDSKESQRPRKGAGFEDPIDGMAVKKGPDAMHSRDHIDAPWNRIEYSPAVKNQPARYRNPSACADKSDDTRASAARAKASCSDECYTGSGNEHWYGGPSERQE